MNRRMSAGVVGMQAQVFTGRIEQFSYNGSMALWHNLPSGILKN